ncbi:carbon-nitrogen hydrolase family protein [Motilimonas cestriensis]|uniref:carbon-nitrogen hydrolase family protein n=1 Tax=Motilimonas cestriensis TaxID=2742685 RepID=UPI003DA27461
MLPNWKVEFYSKQFLHQGEHSYCSFGATDYCFSVAGYRIALAICADFLTPEHSENAANNHADIYITSALISESGYEMDARVLAGIAVKHKMPVLLSNHISHTGGWLACGHSAAWNADGELIVSSEHKQRCLVLCTLANGSMTGAVSEMH